MFSRDFQTHTVVVMQPSPGVHRHLDVQDLHLCPWPEQDLLRKAGEGCRAHGLSCP